MRTYTVIEDLHASEASDNVRPAPYHSREYSGTILGYISSSVATSTRSLPRGTTLLSAISVVGPPLQGYLQVNVPCVPVAQVVNTDAIIWIAFTLIWPDHE